MSVEATLLAMCEAAPAEDEPRTLWADHVGGERGELVHVHSPRARPISELLDAPMWDYPFVRF